MKCEKCGFHYDIMNDTCTNCGAPLENKKDVELKKGKHIDIEEQEEEKEQLSFKETKRGVRNFFLFLILSIIITLVYFLGLFLMNSFSQEVMEQYQDIMDNASLALIYLGNDQIIDEKCEQYALDYDFDYLNIDAKSLSLSRKRKLRKELNIYNLTATLVIVENGKPVTYYSNIKDTEELLLFLQENLVVPSILDNPKEIMSQFKTAVVAQEPTIIYLVTKYDEDVTIKADAIQTISEENGLIYQEIKGYALSQKQLKKIMSQLGFSEIQDDLIIYVNERKITTIVEAQETTESGYFHLFSNRGIINVGFVDSLKSINQKNFLEIIKEKKTNVIFIGTEECSYCERVQTILGQLALQNELTIYYLDATNNTAKISEIIKDLGHTDGLTDTPFVLIVENGKYRSSVIGLADKKLYMDKFLEYGVIK